MLVLASVTLFDRTTSFNVFVFDNRTVHEDEFGEKLSKRIP